MADPFPVYSPALSAPLTDWAAVTPSDTVDLPMRPRALFVGQAGNVVCRSLSGSEVTFALSAGWHPMRPVRILATGTTATGLVAGW